MGIQIGATPDSGFDDPIGMLKDCHRRIEHFLNILCVVVERAAGRVMTEEESAAVKAALNYFREGGVRHNADEEESLFPRLRAESSPNALKELDGLESDHRDASDLHAAAETLYSAWIAAGTLSSDDEQRLLLITRRLKYLYEEHIKVEEGIVFPLAAETLDSDCDHRRRIPQAARMTLFLRKRHRACIHGSSPARNLAGSPVIWPERRG